MTDPTHPQPDRLHLALDHGEVVELDGGNLLLDGTPTPSVVLRLAPWRAHSLSEVLADWSSVSRIFNRPPRPAINELELSRILELAAAAAGEAADPPDPARQPRNASHESVPKRARLAAVQVLAERESRLSMIQRLAIIDAASWWLSEPFSGPQLAHALLEAACTDALAAEHAYLALITPADHEQPDEQPDEPS